MADTQNDTYRAKQTVNNRQIAEQKEKERKAQLRREALARNVPIQRTGGQR